MVYRKMKKMGKLALLGAGAYGAAKMGPEAFKMAKYSLKAIKGIKSMLNVEYKVCDTTANTTPNTTGFITSLSNIQEGADYSNRNGLVVKASSVYLKATLFQNTAANATAIRTMLIIDNDNTGSTPAVTDVLEASNVISPLNHTNGKRFKVIHDKVICVNNNGEEEKFLKVYKKLYHHIRYSNTTTGTREGQLYLLVVSDATINLPAFNYYSRLRYIDN